MTEKRDYEDQCDDCLICHRKPRIIEKYGQFYARCPICGFIASLPRANPRMAMDSWNKDQVAKRLKNKPKKNDEKQRK
jgi:hypothetical protein